MEWSDIKIFLQVVRDNSMSQAATTLGMDHSTISRKIARLERQAGVPLFDRAGRRLAITEEGARLAATAEKLESIILREVTSLSERRAAISGRVRIGTTEDFGVHYLAPRLARIAKEFSELTLELVALPRNFSLATREADFVVTMDRPVSGDIRAKKLTSFAFGVYASPEYFGDRSRPAAVSDLVKETWCGYIPEMLHTPELNFPLPAEPRFLTTSISAQLSTVLSGSALANLPCFVARNYPSLIRLFPAELSPTREYWLAVHEDLASSPRVRAVMNAMDQVISEDRYMFQDLAHHTPFDETGRLQHNSTFSLSTLPKVAPDSA